MKQILIVDDDPMITGLERLLLERTGEFTVQVTTDVSRVENMISEGHFDLVMMDVSLGGDIDGIEMSQRIKANPASHLIPVLLTTAYATKSNHLSLLQLSKADDCLLKPFPNLNMLVQKVRDLTHIDARGNV